MRSRTHRTCVAVACAFLGSASRAGADGLDPPWSPEGMVPLPTWARSVAPKVAEGGDANDMVLFTEANRGSPRRGVTARRSSLPLYGQQRGPGCTGPWWLVGPVAWACSDSAVLSASDPTTDDAFANPSLPYFFVTHSDASAYASREALESGAPDRQLEVGWGVAVVDQATVGGERWARTSKGLWIASADLAAARVSPFRGEPLDGRLQDIAWVVADGASAWPTSAGPPKGKRVAHPDIRPRLQVVHALEEVGAMVRIEDSAWVRRIDLARPTMVTPPDDVVGAHERWIDVDRASQTLVAYEGPNPVFATLVSTGRGPDDSTLTPAGVHRIWIKLLTSDMGHAERDDSDANYSLEDVPYVQFFDHAIALHGTYWHSDFGRARSHGCINLSLADAHWLFAFTNPRLPAAWTAAGPTSSDLGTVIRVR